MIEIATWFSTDLNSTRDERANGDTLRKRAKFWYWGILHFGEVVLEHRRGIYLWTD